MFSHYTRVFGFAKQVLASARKKPVLFAPLVMNIALAVPVNALLIILSLFLSDSLAMALMPVGLSALYFIDYFSGGLNTAMVYEEQTTGNATLGSAFKRTLKSSIGILVFAVVSGLLDFAVQVLSQRRLHMLRPLLLMIRSFWSTATFVIMPTMIIEGLGFGAAFKRSKELAENDPTQIGVGYIGIGLVTSLISLAGFVAVSFIGGRILMPISPVLGMAFSLIVVNATWAIAAYLKSTYYTCFYMWTRECERNRGVNPAFAPAPLRSVLADVDFGSMGIQLAPAAAAVAMAVTGMPAQSAYAMAPQPGGFAAPQSQQGGFAPQPQGGFAPQPQGFAAPQPGGFAPQPQGGFAQPQPQPQPFAPQPQPFAAPQPQPFAAPQPQPFAAPQPQPQPFAAPQPQPFAAPQPHAFTPPQPQPFGAPQPHAFTPPQPQPFAAPQPQPYPQPQPQPQPQPRAFVAAPQPQPYPQPQPQPYPQPQPQAFASAPQSRPFVQPAPQPQPYPQPQPQPRPYAQPQPQPYPQPQPQQRSQPQPYPQPHAAQAPQSFASLHDPGELEDEATVITSSPFDEDAPAAPYPPQGPRRQ